MKLRALRNRSLRIAALGLAAATVAVPAGTATIAEPEPQADATAAQLSNVDESSRGVPVTISPLASHPDEGTRGVTPITVSPVTGHPEEGTRGVQPVADTPAPAVGVRPSGLPIVGDGTQVEWPIVAGAVGGFVVLVLGAFAIGATRRREPLANA